MEKQRLFTKNFTLLIVGQLCSLLGNFTLKFALSMYVLERTGSARLFASMMALALLPMIVLSPFGGILADRANRRNIMVALDICSGTIVILAALLLPIGDDLAVVATLLVMLSVLSAFESPTVQACIPQMLSDDYLLKGNAMVNQVQAITSLFTPFLGSIVYVAWGVMPVLWASAACFFLTAAIECFIRLDFQKSTADAGVMAIIWEEFLQGVHFLRRKEPEVLHLLLLAAVASLFVAGVVVVGFPYLVRTVLGLSVTHYGIAESAMGVAAILGSLFVAIMARRLRMCWMALAFIGLGLCMLPAGLVFMASENTLVIYLVLLLVFCASQFACSFFSTCAISVIQGRTPTQLMGKVMSCVFTLSLCAQPLGQMLYGVAFDAFSASPQWVLLPSGVILCLLGVASFNFFKRLDRL